MYSYVFTYYNSDLKLFENLQGNLQEYVDELSECFKGDKSEVRDKLDKIEAAKNLCEDTMNAMVSLIYDGQN